MNVRQPDELQDQPSEEVEDRPSGARPQNDRSSEAPPLDMTLSHVCSLSQGALHFGLRGEGPPVLMIMGFMARGHGWRSQVDALSSHYQTAWFDHRGVGDSPGPAASSMSEFAQDCISLLDHLGWESAHILGVSMGGMIAQELALRAPNRVRSLTLIVTQAGGVTSIIPTRRGLPLFLRAQFARTTEGRIESLKNLLVPSDHWSEAEEREILRRLREEFTPKPPLSTRMRHFWAILRHQARARLHQVKVPTLIIQAQDDLLVKPKHSETLAQLIPHARLLSVPKAGHGVIRQSKISINDDLAHHLIDSEARFSRALE